MYITSSEWMNQFGGKKVDIEKRPFKPLQYYCCRLSLQPFNVPVCSRDGNVYEEEMILKFLKKHQVEPVTGNPLTKDDLIYNAGMGTIKLAEICIALIQACM